jgi:hypothetical protein
MKTLPRSAAISALILCSLPTMLAGCGGTAPEGPTVDHSKLSETLEQRAAAIEASADEAALAVEREAAKDLVELRAEEAAVEPEDQPEAEPTR